MGVAVRMAVLEALSRNLPNAEILSTVIPGRRAAPDPESRCTFRILSLRIPGSRLRQRPGMTEQYVMLIDRRDRRPILLANARIMDPSRDLDLAGDLLLADGVIREAKRGIGAAAFPTAPRSSTPTASSSRPA